MQDIEHPFDNGLIVDSANREIVYRDFTLRQPDVYYWYLPSRFLGDKVTSYGGNLRVTLRYVPTSGGLSRNNAAEVELISVSISIILLYENWSKYKYNIK